MYRCLALLSLLASAGSGAIAQTIDSTTQITDSRVAAQASERVLTREDIESVGARTLAELLPLLPSVQVASTGPLGQLATLRVRGQTAAGLLVRVDGVPLGSALNPTVDLSSVMLADVEEVRIKLGPSTSAAGLGAAAGIVDITTQAGSAEPNSSVSATVDSFGTGGLQASLNICDQAVCGGTSLILMASEGDFSVPRQDGRVESRLNAGFSGLTARGFVQVDNETSILRSSAQVSTRTTQSPGSLDFPTEAARRIDHELLAQLSWQTALANDWLLDVGGQLSGSDSQFEEPQLLGLNDRHVAGWLAAFGRIRSPVEQPLRFAAFVRAEASALQSTTWIAERQPWLSLFLANAGAEVTWDLGSRAADLPVAQLHAIAALQADSQFGLSPMATIRAAWNPWPKGALSVLALARVQRRAPSFLDVFWPTTSFAIGNPDLRPETHWSLDLDVATQPWPWLRLRGGGYAMATTDLIDWRPTVGGVWKPLNVGQARTLGLELAADALVFVEPALLFFAFHASYAINLVQDWDTGRPQTFANVLPYRPPETWVISASVNSLNGWFVRSLLRIEGFRYRNMANTQILPPAFQWDIHLGFRSRTGWTGTLSVVNLLNQQIALVEGFPVPGLSLRLTLGWQPTPIGP